MMKLLTFTCPPCGAHGQRFPLRSAWRRQAQMPCTGYGVGLRSDPPLGMHSLYLVCMQILLLLATLPVFWAIARGGMDLGGNDLVGAAGAGLVPRRSKARTKPDRPCRAGPQPQLRTQAERMSTRHTAVYHGTI